jgi:hypothetical protein
MNEMADEGRPFDLGNYISDGSDGDIASGSEEESRKRSRNPEDGEESSGEFIFRKLGGLFID